MIEKFVWMFGPIVAVEIGWGRSSGEALHARSDWYRNHVLLQSLVITNSSVASGGKNIDEAILGCHFKPYLRICGKERWNNLRQHQAHRTDGDIEAERACGFVTEAICDVDGCFDLSQGWTEPLQHSCPRLGWHDTARRAMKQPHTKLGLEPPHRIAEPRGTAAAGTGAIAKALGAGHDHEGAQIS